MTNATIVKRFLLGHSLASHKAEHQLLPKVLALPVFSSDPLSSVAYATEEMMLVLAAAGAAALALMLPIGLAIAALLAIVITSYRQTVRAYPAGGGSYIVSRENLGTIPGLDRRGGDPHRLRPHGRGERDGGHRGRHLGSSRASPTSGSRSPSASSGW